MGEQFGWLDLAEPGIRDPRAELHGVQGVEAEAPDVIVDREVLNIEDLGELTEQPQRPFVPDRPRGGRAPSLPVTRSERLTVEFVAAVEGQVVVAHQE
ncbi:unannotated protein [freshwater metagenome]|uniref:Unannotated protein n=1 Tax=freshwater metagenome TaxID=449393 RepID=A0A6J6RYD8_9ZZZZ